MRLRTCLAVLSFCAVSFSANPSFAAGEKPILSADRFSVAAGLNYAAFSRPLATAAETPSFKKEWETGLYAAYNLTPRVSLAGSSVIGLDNRLIRTSLGIRVRLFRGVQ